MTNEPESLTNPADRLLGLLIKAKPISGGTNAQAFAKIFEIDANDTAELYRRLGECDRAVRQLTELVGRVTNPSFEKTFLTSVTSIAQVFTPRHLDQAWDEHKKKILDKDTTALQFCSDLLGARFSEAPIDKATLDDFSKKVDDLYAQVRTSDLEDVLKRTLLDGLQAIRNAIHLYTINGAAGLQAAQAEAAGQYMIFDLYVRSEASVVKDDDPEQAKKKHGRLEIVTKYAKLVLLLGGIIKMAYLAAPQLGEAVHHLFPPPK